jgi:7-cyano-7-deazaguanine synthase in queuosine biosynthesis
MEQVLDISHVAQYWTTGKTHCIETPLQGFTKAEHIARYLDGGGELRSLLDTVSCYNGSDHHCGRCASCFKRWVALTVATGNPLVQYFEADPWESYDLDYLRSRFPTYSAKRIEETRSAFLKAGIDL